MADVHGDNGTDSQSNSPAHSMDNVFPSSPFTESNSKADLILESVHEDRFFVVKAILIQASPVFEAMFSLPQPVVSEGSNEQEFEGDLPVVNVTESSRTLDALLRICYPIRSPPLDDIGLAEIGDVLQAALKYDVDGAVFQIRNALNAPRFRDPVNGLNVFVMACRNGWEGEARRAARDTLKGPIPTAQPFNPILNHIKASVYHKLLRYHEDARSKITTLFDVTKLYWFYSKMPEDIHKHLVCSYGRCAETVYGPCCFRHPNRVVAFLAPSISSGTCSDCIESILKYWTAIVAALFSLNLL